MRPVLVGAAVLVVAVAGWFVQSNGSDRADSSRTALLLHNVETLYDASPQPSWYPLFAAVGGEPDISVRGDVAVASVSANLPAAAALCRAITSAAHDANGRPIGIRHVRVINAYSKGLLVACDTGT